MFGTPTAPALKLKAAEASDCLPFVVRLTERYAGCLGGDAAVLQRAGRAALDDVGISRLAPTNPNPKQKQDPNKHVCTYMCVQARQSMVTFVCVPVT